MFVLLTGDKLQAQLSAGSIPIHCHVSYADWDETANSGQGKGKPGRGTNRAINTTTLTDLLAGPGVSTTERNIKLVTFRAPSGNSGPVGLVVFHSDGATTVEVKGVTLQPGGELQYVDEVGFLEL